MNKTSLAVAAIAVSGASFALSAALGQTDDNKLGKVHFETSCKPEAQKLFDRGMLYQHSFWYRASQRTFEEALKADPELRHRLLGHCAQPALESPHAPPAAQNLAEGSAALAKGKSVGAKTERERDYLAALGAMYADYDKVDHRTRLLAYAKAMEALAARYPERRRSPDPLRAGAQHVGAAGRQDLRQPAQGRGDPGRDRQAPAPASRRRALPDPPLRLSADRRQRHRGRPALRQDRARRAACPAHAVAHLHPRRLLAGIDRFQHGVGTRPRRPPAISTTSCTPWTTWSMPTCSSGRTRRPAPSSTR